MVQWGIEKGVDPVFTLEESSRTRRVIGDEGAEKLAKASVLVFGVGGVGGAICEALARAGVGALTIVDGDVVSPSNLNRQIVALHSTLGKAKVDVMKERIYDICPDIEVTAVCGFYRPGGELSFDFSSYSYVVDAIDDIPAKVELWVGCREAGVPLISAMGAGNKLDPSLFRVADLAKTEGCPLAKIMRKKLKERGIAHGKVVFSPEPPVKTGVSEPGSLSFVPPVAGYVIAGEVIRDILSL